MDLVPGQSLLVELLHEWIWIEFLYVVYAWLLPQALAEHHGTNHGWYTCGVASALHTSFLKGCTMAAVVVYVVSVLLAVIADTTNATADRCLALIVFAQILWVGQYGLQELQRYNLYLSCACAVSQWSLILYLVDTAHADVLDYLKVLKILLTKCHPEACTLDGGVVDNQALYLLMVQQIAVAWADVRIVQILVYLKWLCLYPLAIVPLQSLLGYLSNVDLWVDVGGESLVVVASVTVYDIQILYLLEVMLCSVCSIDACYAWVETTTKDGCKSSLLETVAISPLP